jgi:hypothetical protein
VLPNLPTIAEAGLKDFESTAWYTVAAASKVPAFIVRKLNAAINAITSALEFQFRLPELGATLMGGTPEGAAKYFASETEKWNKVIKSANIHADWPYFHIYAITICNHLMRFSSPRFHSFRQPVRRRRERAVSARQADQLHA